MNFTKAVIQRGGYSKGFCIPTRIQDKYNIDDIDSIYFEKRNNEIRGSLYTFPGAEKRTISENGERPAGGFYLFVTFPKGWINSKHVNVFWDEKEIIIKEIPE